MNEIDVFEIPLSEKAQNAMNSIDNGKTVFDTDLLVPMKIPSAPTNIRGYVPWGSDNLRCNEILELMRKDEVMSSNNFFNILCGYSNGLKYKNADGTAVANQDVIEFFKFNRPTKYLLEQQTDIKHFFFTVSVIILSGDGKKIVKLIHKEATYCRFETCNPENGKIEHVFYGNWEKGAPSYDKLECIELLDTTDPLGDLMKRMGKLPGDDGKTAKATTTRKFAMMNAIPIPGQKYYPFPYYWSLFNSGWYDIKQLIPAGKKAKFTNGLVVKYQVEINIKYWDELFEHEKITDLKKKKERMDEEKTNIKTFLTGIVNAGKVWFSGFYVDPLGKEQSYVRIKVVSNTTEGGDWVQDMEEASSTECYAMGVHPSVIGATPGKSSGNLSGSNVREIFTMKQALETAFKDILLEPYILIKNYNGWDEVEFDIPFMQLTTLDQNTGAKSTSTNPNQNSN
jgi:hypothetical protein